MKAKKKIIKKPWGSEEIIHTNKFYTVKKLIMNSNCRCSLQYHKKKIETIYVEDGPLFIFHGKILKKIKIKKLKTGEFFTLNKKEIHRMFSKSKRSIYLEASTSDLKDLVRIEDDYNRV